VTDREVLLGCARVRTKCAEKTRKAARCKRAPPRGGGTLRNVCLFGMLGDESMSLGSATDILLVHGALPQRPKLYCKKW